VIEIQLAISQASHFVKMDIERDNMSVKRSTSKLLGLMLASSLLVLLDTAEAARKLMKAA
jgi:hypothetical protein